jgi:hypothetical protein
MLLAREAVDSVRLQVVRTGALLVKGVRQATPRDLVQLLEDSINSSRCEFTQGQVGGK